MTSLDQYISRMKTGQKDIFYITGTSKEQLENSPFLERLKKKNFEVQFKLFDFYYKYICSIICSFKNICLSILLRDDDLMSSKGIVF